MAALAQPGVRAADPRINEFPMLSLNSEDQVNLFKRLPKHVQYYARYMLLFKMGQTLNLTGDKHQKINCPPRCQFSRRIMRHASEKTLLFIATETLLTALQNGVHGPYWNHKLNSFTPAAKKAVQ